MTGVAVPGLRGRSHAADAERGLRLAALRVPLASKLVGANLIVVMTIVATKLAVGGVMTRGALVILIIAMLVHFALVIVALRPVHDLEAVASQVWRGDFGARVERSSVADHGVLRIGSMFNILLDDLAADRARLRALAADVIAAGDRERAGLARALHESVAQRVAALLLQLSVAARDASDPVLADRLCDSRDAARSILEEVRTMSHTVHPAVLDDLGLEAGLRRLAREAMHGTGIDVGVHVESPGRRLAHNVEAVLYRVAEEAVRNATRHGLPTRIRINLCQGKATILEVHDDGVGFDPGDASLGLHSLRERVALVDGWIEIKTARGNGTTISATVPGGTRDEIALEGN